MNIEKIAEYVVAESKKNIAFLKENPTHVPAGKQINSSLGNIVTMARNLIMEKAIDRAITNDRAKGLQELRISEARSDRKVHIPKSVS
jgi:hypothetical protein